MGIGKHNKKEKIVKGNEKWVKDEREIFGEF
jgi:hypothetical protein